ncbi:UNVERIFIED_CONTAM: hypothetical protein K2H54_057767 [Gekko kuhli]
MGDRRINTLGQEDCCSGIRSTFNWLVDALRDVLHRQRTEMRAPVSVERRVAVAVWWMANTMSYRTVAHQFGIARSTVAGIVVEVTRAITEGLLERVVYLCDPDKDTSWSAIMSRGRKCCEFDEMQLCKFVCAVSRATVSLRMRINEFIILAKKFEMADPVVGVSSPTDSEAESAHNSGGEQEEAAREEASREEEIPAPQEEEVVVVREEHPRVDISSGTEGEAGEGQVPGPAPRPEPAQPWGRSPLAREVEDLRRTVKRLNYRLGFLERSHKRMRQILQDPQQAHQPSSPLAIVEEGGQAEQEGPPTGPTV